MIGRQFILPMPPTSNHGYKTAGYTEKATGLPKAVTYKGAELKKWETEVAKVIGDYEPPKRTPLRVDVTLWLPRTQLYKIDVDGPVKFCLDRVIGKRRDQWITRLTVTKLEQVYAPCVVVNVEETA